MDRPVVPTNCYFQGCYNPEYEREIARCKAVCHKYNQICPNEQEKLNGILRELLGQAYEDTVIVPPFWCDYGYHIKVGKAFYANHNLVVQDGAGITIGDHVFIAPNCCLTTAEHPLDPQMRADGIEIAKPITIGNHVWIGAGSTILAGAVIGDNTVIGAGSVVKGTIPANVVAVGVPCKVLRPITEEDKYTYPWYKG